MVMQIRFQSSSLLILFVFSVLFLFAGWAQAKSLKAFTDRDSVEYGDVITLVIEADFQTLGHGLDYESLNKDFEVLNRQRSNFYEVINGVQSARTRWTLRMLANQPGEYTIDQIRLDDVLVDPITIKVAQQAAPAPGKTPDFFMMAEVSDKQAYVQQEVLYRLRFYYLGRLVSGNIRPPELEQSMVHTLKEESNYSKQIDGKYYTVFEWLYAFYPQASGDFEFLTPNFEGLIQYNGRQKLVTEKANSVTIKVKPIPADYPKNEPWLPAKSVLLKQLWKPTPSTIKVGDSLDSNIVLQVFGMRSNQLPQLNTLGGENFKVYAQPAVTEEEILRDGMVSRIESPEVIVPTKAGELIIPERTVYWWNVVNDRLESIALPPRRFEIAASNVAANTTQVPQAMVPNALALPNSAATSNDERSDLAWLIWPLVTTFFAIAWVITLIMWWLARKSPTKVVEVMTEETPVSQWNAQWQHDPASELYRRVRSHISQLGYEGFKELPESLQQQISALEAHLFKGQEFSTTERETLSKSLDALVPVKVQKNKRSKATQLAKMYP